MACVAVCVGLLLVVFVNASAGLSMDSAVPMMESFAWAPTPDGLGKRDYIYPELSCPQAPQPVELPANWREHLQPHFDLLVKAWTNQFILTNHTLGMTVAVVYDQKILWKVGLGSAEMGPKARPVSPDNIFRIGSISKVFPDLMLLQLRDRGVLDLDEEIGKKFPQWRSAIQNVFPTKRGITWRQLGSHMAGLPRSSPCGSLWGDCNVTTDEILRRIHSQKTIQPIDTRPSYSNFGFALLGRLLEELVGESFESYVEKNILRSLNMTNTGFKFTPKVQQKMAVGYFDGTDQPAPLYDLGWEAPAGQMYSTVEDLCHLMSLIFRDNYTEYTIPSQILDGQTIKEWLIPLYDSAAAKYGLASMGMPWENVLLTNPGNPNYWQKGKSGAVFGYTAEIMMIPELKLGVAVLMNGGLGGPALTAALQANAVLVPPLTQLLRQVQVPPALPPHPQNIVGSYKAHNNDPLPPILQGTVTADVRLIQDENNVTRVLITLYIGGSPFFAALLDYYEAFNKDSNQLILQAAISSHPDLCDEVLGGGNQLVYFTLHPTTGVASSFEIKGLYYGFIFHHT